MVDGLVAAFVAAVRGRSTDNVDCRKKTTQAHWDVSRRNLCLYNIDLAIRQGFRTCGSILCRGLFLRNLSVLEFGSMRLIHLG